MSGSRYTELQVTTHFSFLRGASSSEELFATAAVMGVEALAVVDRNSLAGVVRAHEAAKTTGVRLVVGCRLDLTDGYSVLVYPTDRPAYSRLCRLLSLGKKRAGKARCELGWPDLVAYREGLIAVLVPDEADEDCAMRLRRLRDAFGDRAYMALTLRRRPNDQLRLFELANLATRMRVAPVPGGPGTLIRCAGQRIGAPLGAATDNPHYRGPAAKIPDVRPRVLILGSRVEGRFHGPQRDCDAHRG